MAWRLRSAVSWLLIAGFIFSVATCLRLLLLREPEVTAWTPVVEKERGTQWQLQQEVLAGRLRTVTAACSLQGRDGVGTKEVYDIFSHRGGVSRRDVARDVREDSEESYRLLASDPSQLNHIIVDDRHKLLYCYVPKVACTNWKRMLLVLAGKTNFTNPVEIPPDSVHRAHVFTKLSDLQPSEVLSRLRTYTKFLFVRHPIERVLSAFRNKFERNYTSSAYFKKRFGVKIIKKYRKNLPPNKVLQSGHGVKFSEFVSYLVDTARNFPQHLNEHWAPVTSLCHPCTVRYGVIGKYETLAADAEYLLRTIDPDGNLHFPQVVPSKTSKFVNAYVFSLTSPQLRDFINMYSDDFKLFDYHFQHLI